MAERRRGANAASWLGVAAALGLGAVLAWPAPHGALDWQPARVTTQPWRAFSAVFVHYSALHLGANLLGGALVAVLGHAARVPPHCTLAWLAAWPLTQLGLLLQPALSHYGGLSGVLHAGVAVVGVHLLLRGSGRLRRIGAAIVVALIAKVLLETPWVGPVRYAAGWDIAVAPFAHASGLAMGLLCALVAEALARRAYHRPS